jgi:hypothetical protein
MTKSDPTRLARERVGFCSEDQRSRKPGTSGRRVKSTSIKLAGSERAAGADGPGILGSMAQRDSRFRAEFFPLHSATRSEGPRKSYLCPVFLFIPVAQAARNQRIFVRDMLT